MKEKLTISNGIIRAKNQERTGCSLKNDFIVEIGKAIFSLTDGR
jgi:hypothetical protein